MKKAFLLLMFFVLGFQNIKAQEISKIDYNKLSKLEGMECLGGITFYIEKKDKILIAVQNDTIKWKADVIKNCGKRKVEINSVFIGSGKLKVSFGKNRIAFVNIKNGEIECLAEKKNKRKDQDKDYIDFTNQSIIKK
ncbi:hypothetical protein [Flavobacterium sp. Root420]|uniref:hypothetical protein n=1 Tax=Flavobacterium sp. Root420 TaxID=1736533 RepID=UPI0006F33C58|nr:hypothetical protein [Flavobacterium sp. Root420]KQW96177.1 hypothetical protein ASC72_17095 [Flavobacterium sp. Root420]